MNEQKVKTNADRSGFPVEDCCGCEPDECTKAWLAWLRAPVEGSYE